MAMEKCMQKPVCPMSWNRVQDLHTSGQPETLRRDIFLCGARPLYFPSSHISRPERVRLDKLIQSMLQEELKRLEATLGRTEAIEKFSAKTEEAIQQWQKYFKDAVQYNAAHPENSEIARAW